VERLIAGGATLIQLRDKHSPPDEFYEAALAAVAAAHKSSVKLIINDRVDVALATGADGVHLGQDDLPPAEARRLLGSKAIIGFSTHNEHQAAEACDLPIDYIAFGPVFPTRTKEDPDPVVGLERLTQIRKIIGSMPLVAIGGINGANITSVLRAHADSAALISYLLKDPQRMSQTLASLLDAI
jgi:thiamine-phosphate pyrophosphorylase